jgi:dUTP pyrophosphatase
VDQIIPSFNLKSIATDICLTCPKGTYGRIASRSGLSLKHYLNVFGGVIDADYTGNIKVMLFNFKKTPYYIQKGDKIAQLIFERIHNNIQFIPVLELKNTKRGNQAFGSSGY